MPPEAMQHPSQGRCSPCPRTQEVTEGLKFYFPSCPFPKGGERRGSDPTQVLGCSPGTVPEARHCPSPDTYTKQPRQLRTPKPAHGGGKGDNLLGAQFGSKGAELLKREGGTQIRGGSVRGSSRVPSPPWCPWSCGNIPAVAPPPPLGSLRSPSLPGLRRRRLKGTAAPRCPATSGAAAS